MTTIILLFFAFALWFPLGTAVPWYFYEKEKRDVTILNTSPSPWRAFARSMAGGFAFVIWFGTLAYILVTLAHKLQTVAP